jgi:hypothetical protein
MILGRPGQGARTPALSGIPLNAEYRNDVKDHDWLMRLGDHGRTFDGTCERCPGFINIANPVEYRSWSGTTSCYSSPPAWQCG